MADPVPVVAALAAIPAGLAAGAAVLALGRPVSDPAARWLRRRRGEEPAGVTRREGRPRPVAALAPGRDWLQLRLERAGWRETAPRFAAGTGLAAAACALAAGGVGSALGVAGLGLAAAALLAVPSFALFALTRAAERHREALLSELCPILELLSLELSAGGSPRASLEAVLTHLEGPLASRLRRLLITAQLAGSEPLETRLAALADRLQVQPLAGLAAILASSREYGTSVSPGVRALAADLRRRQRRRLIAISRRALNRVLIPAAVGVLLPFMGVLLFPAVATLTRNFH